MQSAIEIARLISLKLYPLPEQDMNDLAAIIICRDVSKGTKILKEGDQAQCLNYIGSGLTRQYYFKNGHEITEHFGCPGDFVYCIESLFEKKPTHLLIDAEEDSEIYSLDYENLLGLFATHPPIAMLIRKLFEQSLIRSQHKADSIRFETARARYERFIEDYPYAAVHAKLNDIASYLVMTPESLSRIRAGVL